MSPWEWRSIVDTWRVHVYGWSVILYELCAFVCVRGWLLQCTAAPPSRRRQLMRAIVKHKTFFKLFRWEIPLICTKSHTTPVFINLFTVTCFGSNFETSSAFYKADTEKLHTAFTLEIHHKCIKPFTYTSNVKEGQPWDTCVYVNICYIN